MIWEVLRMTIPTDAYLDAAILTAIRYNDTEIPSDDALQVFSAITQMAIPRTTGKLRVRVKMSKEKLEEALQELQRLKIIRVCRDGRIKFTPLFKDALNGVLEWSIHKRRC